MHEVTVTEVPARPTAVVAATTTWQEFPTLWMELSGEVWACLRAAGIQRGARNVMLYLDDVPHVEVGVELTQPCPLTGRVVSSELPAGEAAMTTRWGSYAELGAAHQAVQRLVRRARPAIGLASLGGVRAAQRRSRPGVDGGLLPSVVSEVDTGPATR